jgi:hypothetical protein
VGQRIGWGPPALGGELVGALEQLCGHHVGAIRWATEPRERGGNL